MSSYNYSYNVLINRLEAFAAGHFLIRRFTHGQIDMSDQLQDDQYPFMHVTPDTIEPVQGAMNFSFHIMFADIPRDKEYKAEYQREVISDCIRLGQDLIAEVKNGLELFGFDVQLLETPTFEPFMEEQKNTVTGVAFTLKLSVPWDWSACDIPAIWSVGGASGSGGTGTGYGIELQTNGVDNVVQTKLNLVDGTNITITDLGNGSVTIDAAGGTVDYVSTEFNVNHTTATGNQYVIGDRVWYNGNVYQCIANNDALLPTNTLYWVLVSVGNRLRQTPVDWNATSGDFQVLNKPTIPPAQVNSDWNAISGVAEILNKPTIPAAQVNSDWNASSGIAQILNKPSLATVATTGSYTDLINQPTIPAGQIQSDWTQVNTAALDFIKNKPTIVTPVNADWSAISGLAQILNKPTIPAAQVNSDWNAVSGLAQILNKPFVPSTLDSLTDVNVPTPTNGQVLTFNTSTGQWIASTPSGGGGSGTVTSVALTAPAAFNVSGSPVTTSGTLAITAAGNSTQYIDGGGALQTFPTIPPAQVNSDWNAVSGVAEILNKPTIPAAQVNSDWNAASGVAQILNKPTITSGTVTSVALTVPSAFNVTGSPITSAGTLAITGAGLATQYVRGDGQLANFPTTSGGGSSVSYYLNGSINQGTIGGSTYYQMSKTAVFGAGTDFTRTNGQGNGLIAQFITDANDPNVLLVPGGNFNLELFFNASSGGGSPSFYVELYKYDGTTFTLLATDVATPEGITQGTVIDAYYTALAVPATVMTLTDRLALRVFVTTSGRTLKLHTENGHLCQVITTLSTGINAINGLTSQVQNLATGTAGSDFAISSTGSTHTFNLPTASAANRGALSSADWSTFNGKQDSIGLTTVGTNIATLPNPSATRYLRINADNTVSALTLAELKSDIGVGGYAVLTSDFITSGVAFQNITGLQFNVTAGKTYKWRATIIIVATGTVNGALSTNGPAGTTTFRFTTGTGVSTNVINNGVANNTGTVFGISTLQRIASADGIYIASANGTVSMSVIASVNGLITIKAGSIVEFEEVA
jgi:hypothetical protein